MKKTVLLLAMMGAMLLSTASVMADDGFYVIAGLRPNPGTKITSLPYEIKNPGFYYLTQNLTYSGSTNAIIINADNVTLDLMGFRLICTATSGSPNGVLMAGRKNVEIRNGTLRGFWTGIYENSGIGANHRVINVRAIYGTIVGSIGIYLGGSGHLVKDCNASNNTDIGIFVSSGTVAGCVASNNGKGIQIIGPGDALGNAVFNNSVRSFDLGNGLATAIMVDRNSAFGLNPNYYVVTNTEGVQWGINAGAP